ncbi:MAG TPA: cohesin domain-containing protein, partial [Candidatus Ratteibacteria bacterium]|nr:cohesin domain-containing protein [Candidatus Ratteibacteria bacterium]
MSWKKAVMSAVCFLFLGFASFSNAVTVSIPNTEIAPGTTTVEIPINVDNANGVVVFTAVVKYDNTILDYKSCTGGTLIRDLVGDGDWAFIKEVDEINGKITLLAAALDTENPIALSGGGTLVSITFNILGVAGQTSAVYFSKVSGEEPALVDAQPQQIQATWVDGSVHITGYTLRVNISGSGTVETEPGPSSYGDYIAGTSVTLTAIPSTGYKFASWSGDLTGSTNPGTIVMNGNKTVTANFTTIPRYKIIININPLTVGTANPITKNPVEPSNGYLEGTEVELTAIPLVTVVDKKYRFVNWTQGGTVLGTTPTLEITMDANKTITANYEEVHEPWVSVDTTAIVFKSTGETEKTFTITNTGEDGLMWSLETDLSWIDINPRTGGPLAMNASETITLRKTDGNPGDSGKIIITNETEGTTQTTPIEINVRINIPPSVEIIFPKNDENVAVETFLTLRAKFFSEGMIDEKGATIESSKDKIVESTWEIYSGATIPTGKNGSTLIYSKVLKKDIPDGEEFALEVPWALFNHEVLARQIEENEYWWKVSCEDTPGEKREDAASFVVVRDETTDNQQFNLITDEIDEEEIVNKFNTELPDVTVFQHAFKDAVNS